jgi:hypothetical protein
MKKVWKKPKLVGICRARSHEAVLSCCKSYSVAGDPAGTDINCQQDLGERGCACCNSCDCS